MSSDDIDAINSYIVNAAIKTPEAGNLQAQWKTYYGNLGFFDKGSDATLAEASNRRTVFNAANQQPEDIQGAADLSPARQVAKQAAIASSTALSPAQKQAALAKNPNIKVPASTPGAGVAHTTIRQNSTGPDVAAWQQILGVAATGVFDAGTVAATKKWQASHGLTADGVVGPKTWAAALSAAASPAAPPAPVAAPVAAPKPVVRQVPIFSPAPAALVPATASGASPLVKAGLPVAGMIAGAKIAGVPGAIVGALIGWFGSSKLS